MRPTPERWALPVLVLVAACAPALPRDPVERALVRDVSRVVDVRSRVGWLIDESEILGAIPDALRSVCQVERPSREAALRWLDQEIAAQGGDVAAVWRNKGRSFGAIDDLLQLTRVRLLLRRAGDWADHGSCPFWLEPSPRFAGVNTQGHRFLLTLEGGGRFMQEVALGQVKYGGGGSGRLLVGYGFAESWSAAFGVDLGGVARFTNLQLGQQSDLPDLVGLGVLPAVVTWHFGLSAYAEAEAGPMAYFNKGMADPTTRRVEVQFDRGLHLGVAAGASYLRLERGLIPKFALAFTVDHVPGVSGRPTLTQFGIGLRTGIDMSRWRGF